jgi:CRP/FNR family transcriptional regulator, cyclic AMP receptor protein
MNVNGSRVLTLKSRLAITLARATTPRMNRFRKLGFIDYNGELQVHSSLMNVVLHD